MSVKAIRRDSAFSLPEADEPAGSGLLSCRPNDAAEAFYVLEGEYIIFLDVGRCPALPDRLFVHRNAHGLVSNMASRKLNFYTQRPWWAIRWLSEATSTGG